MATEFIIYADESEESGAFYSNFYGGAVIVSNDFDRIVSDLNGAKQGLNLFGELKWSKVTAQYLEKYLHFTDRYFDFVRGGQIKIRIMFRQNTTVAKGLDTYQRDHAYYLLYYQFIKHAFGLQYANPAGPPVSLRIYLDKLPDSREKATLFKTYLASLERSKEFRRSNLRVPVDQIAEVTSHDHVILQGLDIILGAMQFRLNDKHLKTVAGCVRRGKKTVAKETLYKNIVCKIKEIHPRFNIGINTGRDGKEDNLWHHAYRHWRFVPKNAELDLSRAKNR